MLARMKKLTLLLWALAGSLGAYQAGGDQAAPGHETTEATDMDLGAFSISLAVKDLATSRAFYEALGFEQIGGTPEHNYLILRNGEAVVGLFQGMFEQNILTFNPGWAGDGQHPEEYTDVRELQRRLEAAGLELTTRADESSTGPAHLTLVDPDGNPILIDQHR